MFKNLLTLRLNMWFKVFMKLLSTLRERLSTLCESSADGLWYVHNGFQFKLRGHEAVGLQWIDLCLCALPLTEENAIDVMSTALSVNGALFAEYAIPTWFGLEGGESPVLVLYQRFFDAPLNEVDILTQVAALAEQLQNLKQDIDLLIS